MRYNLFDEPWLPVLLDDGRTEWIRPWEIVGDSPLPRVLNPKRADFKAALMEWLVGLLQTAFPPKDMRMRDRLLREPPGQEALREAFSVHGRFFNLFGERPRFLQDLTMGDADKPVRNGVGTLLVEQPGGITLRENRDFFIKRGQVNVLCPACAAAALYTLQAFAPSGGRGHRTSMRGGGPLSTLAVGETLWESAWLNVTPPANPAEAVPDADALASRVYAWAAPTRTSDNNELVHPHDMHPLHVFWGMPRRIVLLEEEGSDPCDVCGRAQGVVVREFLSRPNGYNYGPQWLHPLTPYTHEVKKPPLSIKGRHNIAAYSNWLGIVYGEDDGKRSMHAAHCVTKARRMSRRINVAGYDMDNAKARQWCEHVFPVFPINGSEVFFGRKIRALISAADVIRRNLLRALRDALVNECGKKRASADRTLFDNAGTAFWGRTEDVFYRQAGELAALPDSEEAETRCRELYLEWGRHLFRQAIDLFKETTARLGIPPERMERYGAAGADLVARNINQLRKLEMYPPKEVR